MGHTKRRFFRAILAAAVGAYAVWSAATTQARAADEVIFSWLPTIGALPFLVALEDKMFQAEGIEPVPHKFETPSLVVDSFVSGRSEVGTSTAAAISLIANARFPETTKYFGFSGGSLDPSIVSNALVVLKDSPLNSIADLKGKKVGVVPGIQWRTLTRHVIRTAGLDPDKDVQLVELALPVQAQALVGRNVDALLSIEPMVSMALATGDVKVIDESPADKSVSNPFWIGAAVITTKFLKERPAVAAKVIKVMNEATEKVQNDFERYKPLLTKYAGVPASALPFVKPMLFRSESQLTDADVAAYQKLSDVLYKEGVMAQAVDVRSLMVRLSDLK